MDELTSTQRQVLEAVPQLLSRPTIIDTLFNCVSRDVDELITQTSLEDLPLRAGGGDPDRLCKFGCDVSETLIDLAFLFGTAACCAGTVGTACVVCSSAALIGSKASASRAEKCESVC
jgi:hypothetical protein